jgi:hypothetical protein
MLRAERKRNDDDDDDDDDDNNNNLEPGYLSGIALDYGVDDRGFESR